MISGPPTYMSRRAETEIRPAAPDGARTEEIGSPRPVLSRFEGLRSGHTAHVEKASPRY